MNLHEQIRNHVSIRKFQDRSVPESILTEILQCGIRAASSGNMQFYSVVATEDPKLRKRLYEAHARQEMILQAPIVLTFCSDLQRIHAWMVQEEAEANWNNWISFFRGVVDACLVAQNIALAAQAHGLGICYMGTTLTGAGKIIEILSLPQRVFPVTSMVMGYPAESPSRRDRLPLEGVVHRDMYQPFSPATIERIHRERSETTWERFQKNPAYADLIREKNLQNIAQVYAAEKYHPETLEQYSAELIAILRRQFMLE